MFHRPVVPHVLRADRGLAGQVRRRTVVGMLLGADLARAWPHDRAHYFFARARWQADDLGLAVARLAVLLLVPPGEPLTVAVDDSVFRRAGRKTFILSRGVSRGCDLRHPVVNGVLDGTRAA